MGKDPRISRFHTAKQSSRSATSSWRGHLSGQRHHHRFHTAKQSSRSATKSSSAERAVRWQKAVSIPLSSLHGLQRLGGPKSPRSEKGCFHTAKQSSRSATRRQWQARSWLLEPCFHTAKQSSRSATVAELNEAYRDYIKRVSIPLSSLHGLQLEG